jgi:hypothetical protein
MAKLHWVGPEVYIGRACSITDFVIYSIRANKRRDKIRAKGTLTFIDYGEHAWDYTRNWSVEANRDKNGLRVWTVKFDDKISELKDEDCAKVKECLHEGSPSTYVVIPEEKWIVGMIEEYLEKGREALEEKVYTGPTVAYTGPCVCEEFSQKLMTNARWNDLTEEGQFPRYCFRCSCGTLWHFNYANRKKGWTKVSEKAFDLLSQYNGKVMQSMHIHEGVACLTVEIGGGWI